MELLREKNIKYTFSGHDSFHCRQFWLKKGYDFVSDRCSFNSESAVVDLGVGKNMVASIRFWLRSFHVTNTSDDLTAFGISLLSDNGYDPFLEDDGSLWLLHYYLVKTGYASIYSLIFNEYRREKIEFNRESFLSFIKRKAETEKGMNVNLNTVSEDFDVFRRMYLSSNSDKGSEDGFSGLLSELLLVSRIEKKIDNKKEEYFSIDNTTKFEVPLEIFLYTVLENENYGLSISLNSLEHDVNSPGAIFAMNRLGIIEKLKEAQQKYDWITYNDHAGIKELQFRQKPQPFTILESYYGQD